MSKSLWLLIQVVISQSAALYFHAEVKCSNCLHLSTQVHNPLISGEGQYEEFDNHA